MRTRTPAPFETATYRSQLARLRAAARLALSQYPIRLASFELLNHGENTTFRVRSKGGESYTLRIHRRGYHSRQGLDEELRWIRSLRGLEGIRLPVPVLSKRGDTAVVVEHELLDGPRHCDLLVWVDGRFKSKGLSEADLFALGKLTATLHLASRRFKPKARAHYWTADGLLGPRATFGPFTKVGGATPREQRLLDRARLALLRSLRAHEKRFPERLCMIHADFHFGNVLWLGNGVIGLIDFDDSGRGFRMYDLAVTAWALKRGRKIPEANRTPLKEALLRGYESVLPLDRHDREVLDDLILARELVLLQWLNMRRDNPKLESFRKEMLKRVVRELS